MLDFALALTLRRIAEGDLPARDDETRAVGNLLAAGLVVRGADGELAVSDAGRAALEAGVPSRLERWGMRVLVLALAVFAFASLADWIAG